MIKGIINEDENLKNIKFSKKLPTHGIGILCNYNYDSFEISGWENFDLRRIIKEKESEWLDELDIWHLNLSNAAIKLTKWWPLSAGSRMHIWSNGTKLSFKSLFYALAINELKKRNPNKVIMVVGAPKIVENYFEKFNLDKKNLSIFENIIFSLKIFKKFLYLLVLSVLTTKSKISKVDILITTMNLNIDNFQKTGDHFFGKIFLDIESNSDKKLAWLYSDLELGNNNQKKILNEINNNIYFLVNFLKLSILIKSFRTAIHVRKEFKKLIQNEFNLYIRKLNLGIFEYQYINNLIINYPIFDELVHYEIWTQILKNMSPNFIVYPYEEKTMERAMQLAILDNGNKILSIGFAHAAYSKGHLYLRGFWNETIPKPSLIAVTGPIAKDLFIKLGYPSERLTIIGSPRYRSYLESTSTYTTGSKKILLLIGHGFELMNFSKLLTKQKGVFSEYQLSIRRYPFGWKKEQDEAEKRLNELEINYIIADGVLSEEINKVDIVIFDSTSAGIEAVLGGKIVVQLDLAETLESDQFNGLRIGDMFNKCKNIDDLISILNYIFLQNPDEYKRLAHDQRQICEKLFAPIEQDKLYKLLT